MQLRVVKKKRDPCKCILKQNLSTCSLTGLFFSLVVSEVCIHFLELPSQISTGRVPVLAYSTPALVGVVARSRVGLLKVIKSRGQLLCLGSHVSRTQSLCGAVAAMWDGPACERSHRCGKVCWIALLSTLRGFQKSMFICFRGRGIGLFLHYVFSYKFGVVQNGRIKYFYGFLLKVLQQSDSLMLFMNCLFLGSFLHCREHMESVHTYCKPFFFYIFITKCLKDTRYCFIYFIWIICRKLSSCVFRATIYSIN